MPYAASRAGDLRIVSKAQWDKEGVEGFDKRPGGHRLVPLCRPPDWDSPSPTNGWTTTGAAKSRISRNWRSASCPRRSTRLAMLLSGEAHVVDLPRELQEEALNKGMKIFSSSPPVGLDVGLFRRPVPHPRGPQVQGGRALDRQTGPAGHEHGRQPQGVARQLFAGKGTPTYVSGWLPISGGLEPGVGEALRPALWLQPRPRPRSS